MGRLGVRRRRGAGWTRTAATVCVGLAAASFAAGSGAAAAVDAVELRALAVAEDLHCVVCRNQSLAESNSELAADLRRKIRDLIAQGMSDEQVVGFMVARYGESVRYRPASRLDTLLLWLAPFVLMLLSVGFLYRYFREIDP
ncbi:MAG: cytochrome c-type biogenesis protein CcmH [Rhodocyclales bacterium]|nr:cytochrome c-type biogenesis protein CcmH [Rhodocyclales bacterium]